MAKRTRPSKDEITSIIFGINPRTFEIESLSRTRAGKLTRSESADCQSYTHQIEHGRDAGGEATTVFRLLDVFSVPPLMLDGELTKRRLEQMQKRASEMKSKAEKTADKKPKGHSKREGND